MCELCLLVTGLVSLLVCKLAEVGSGSVDGKYNLAVFIEEYRIEYKIRVQ